MEYKIKKGDEIASVAIYRINQIQMIICQDVRSLPL